MIKTRYEPYLKYKPSGVEWIGEIPEGWDFFKILWAYLEIGSGNTPTSSDPSYYDDNGYPWVITGDLNDGILQETTKQITQKAIIDNPSLKKYKKGALILAMYGATIGRLSLLDIEAYTNQACCILGHSKFLTNRFSFYWLIGLREHIINLSAGGGQPNISQKIIKQISINVPSLPEQRAIADFLDRETERINGIVAMQTRMIELLKEKRSALITQAVTKGLDPKAKMKPSGVQWIGDIPEGWEVKKIKWASSIKNSNVNKKTEKGEKTILLCNYVDVYKNDFIDDSIDFMEASATDDEIKKFILRENDVIITKDSEEWSDIAIPAFITKNFNNVICGYHLALLRPKPRDLYGKYLFRGLQSKPINTQFMVSANGITRFGLGLNSISSAYIILPPLSEQHAIADFLDRETLKVGTMVDKIEKQIELLNEYKQSLITHAVTGKIDVRGEINAQNP